MYAYSEEGLNHLTFECNKHDNKKHCSHDLSNDLVELLASFGFDVEVNGKQDEEEEVDIGLSL